MKRFISLILLQLCFYPTLSVDAFSGRPTPTANPACVSPPDVSDYTLHEGSYTLAQNARFPDGGEESLYITGATLLSLDSDFYGDIYSVGDVELKNKAVVYGSVYSENGVVLRGSTSEIKGDICEYIDPVDPPSGSVPIYLPVDELIGECNEIFPDAVQSYITESELFMQNGTQILDSTTNLFQFSSISGYYNGGQPPPNSCGNGTQCGITSPQSQSTALSPFTITANNNGQSFALWNNEQVELGGTDEDNNLYNGTVFEEIKAGSSSIITFLPQDYDQGEMYQIDTLIVQNTATVKLSAGVYAVHSLKLDGTAQIEIVGNGDVFLFVDHIDGNLGGQIKNDTDSMLYFVINSNANINSSSSVKAALYSNGNLLLGVSFTVYGQVAARNLTMQGSSKIVNNVSCDPPVDDNQFVIITQPNALTCEPHPVTLQVLKSNGDINRDYVGVVDLTATSTLAPTVGDTIGDWSMVVNNGRLDNKLPYDGIATYEFDGSEKGQIALMLAVTTVTDISVVMSQGALASEAKPISFQSSMIKVEQSCANPIAGQCINIANQPFPLTLTAVKSDKSQTCVNYDPNNLSFWSENTPIKFVDINQTTIGETEADAVVLPIVFSAGVATVEANYPDAGQIGIHVKDADITEINGEITTIVNPFKLLIDELTEHQRNLEFNRAKSSGAFIRASVPNYSDLQVDTFDLTAKAIIDCTTAGVATNCGGTIGDSVYKIAPSFAHDIKLIPSVVTPYSLGNLDYEGSLSVSLTEGEFTYQDLAYSEAGDLGIALESINYLLSGNNITVEPVMTVGHFYPDYFAFGSYNLTSACNDFTYLGQKTAQISYVLQAYSQATTPAVTVNYDASLGYPIAPTANFSDSAYDQAPLSLTTRLLRDSYYNQVNWGAGIYTVNNQLIGLDRIENTPDGPYFFSNNNLVDYFIKLIGDDGEKVKRGPSDNCTDNMCAIGNLGDFAYGRLQAGNGHGSEFQSIRTTIEATYFNGSEFVPFARDNCTELINTQLSATPPISSTREIEVGSGKTTLSILNSPLIGGKSYFEFTAPDSRGKLNYFIQLKDLSNANLYAPWLLDSGNAVTCTDGTENCISGYVEFGLFRGNDRIIYRMQTFD